MDINMLECGGKSIVKLISENWPRVSFNYDLKLLMIVYVDDLTRPGGT